jgi:septal ring factor EnvC (AmiA/AmiB activator)
MSKLNDEIDALYQASPSEFVAARAAAARGFKGDEARELLKLRKPTAVPWAVNQVYWKARPAYDRVLRSGQGLRKQQLAALKGRAADVREAADAHRQAVSAAVAEAVRLANAENLKPPADELARMFEAISLAASPPETPGRWTTAEQAQGFDALAGVPLAKSSPAPKAHAPSPKAAAKPPAIDHKALARAAAAEERARREAERGVETASRTLTGRQRAADEARTALERLEREVREAEEALAEARTRLDRVRTGSS